MNNVGRASTPVLAPLRGQNVTLAFIAGYIDTLGFVALFGLFVAHVTGNFILTGAGVAGVGGGQLLKLLALPAFIAGILAARVCGDALRDEPQHVQVTSLYMLQIVLLTAFMISGACALPLTSVDSPLAIVCGVLGAAGMGVQNAHSRITGRDVAANTVMTGNLTQAVIDMFDSFSPNIAHWRRQEVRARLRRSLPPIFAFSVGAGGGALGWLVASFWSLVIPLALLGALSIAALLAGREPRS